MRIGVFHPGTQHSWQTALAFQESGQLAWYATSVFYDPGRWPYRIERFLPGTYAARIQREFRRRHFPLLNPANVRRFGLAEWLETAARRLKRHRLSNFFNVRGNVSFGRSVNKLTEKESVDAVWGYNSSALEVFRWAKKRGIFCILDQSIGHPAAMNRVMLEEMERHPEFFLESYTPFHQSWIDRQDEEAALADLVVVGSEFCAKTMIENGCPAGKLRVVPYGYDETIFPKEQPERPPLNGRPVRFLFVGTIIPRKGVAYLLEAFEDIPETEASLTLVGRLAVPERTFARYAHRVQHFEHVPRPEVVTYFMAADCFVFPSLFEGSALVLNEALGAGLGVVQTKSSGTGVQDGANGVLLEKASKKGLLHAILDAMNEGERLERWQEASWALREKRSWKVYRQSIRKLIL